MRIFFVNRYFHPDHSISSQLLADLAFHLANKKHTVTVVTSNRRHDDPAATLPPKETILDVNVIRLEGSSGGSMGLPGLATEVISFHRAVYQALVELVQDGDVVIAMSDPPLLSVICERATQKQNAHLVNWLGELYPEVTQSAEKPVSGPVAAMLVRARKPSYRKAKCNVTMSTAMRRRLNEIDDSLSAVRVINPWGLAGLDKAAEVSGSTLRKTWKLEDRFVIGYSGALEEFNGFESLLTGIEQTAGLGKKAMTWLFVGGGEGMQRLRESVPMRALKVVQFQDYLPLHRTAEGLAVPDLHVISMLPDMEGVALPASLPGALASGKPLIYIGDKGGEIGTMLQDEGCGIVVQSGDAGGIAAAIAQLHSIPDTRKDMGRRSRELYEKRFARKSALDAWTDLLTEIASI